MSARSETTAGALEFATNRLESIAETHPEIALADDLVYLRESIDKASCDAASGHVVTTALLAEILVELKRANELLGRLHSRP